MLDKFEALGVGEILNNLNIFIWKLYIIIWTQDLGLNLGWTISENECYISIKKKTQKSTEDLPFLCLYLGSLLRNGTHFLLSSVFDYWQCNWMNLLFHQLVRCVWQSIRPACSSPDHALCVNSPPRRSWTNLPQCHPPPGPPTSQNSNAGWLCRSNAAIHLLPQVQHLDHLHLVGLCHPDLPWHPITPWSRNAS